MIQKTVFVICFLSAVTFAFQSCNDIPGSRKQCYVKESCENAQNECLIARILLCSKQAYPGIIYTCSTAAVLSSCNRAEENCMNRCNAEHIY